MEYSWIMNNTAKQQQFNPAEYKGAVSIGKYIAIPSRTDHMLPHCPTEEMVRLHNWHLYTKEGLLVLTEPLSELRAAVARWETQWQPTDPMQGR